MSTSEERRREIEGRKIKGRPLPNDLGRTRFKSQFTLPTNILNTVYSIVDANDSSKTTQIICNCKVELRGFGFKFLKIMEKDSRFWIIKPPKGWKKVLNDNNPNVTFWIDQNGYRRIKMNFVPGIERMVTCELLTRFGYEHSCGAREHDNNIEYRVYDLKEMSDSMKKGKKGINGWGIVFVASVEITSSSQAWNNDVQARHMVETWFAKYESLDYMNPSYGW